MQLHLPTANSPLNALEQSLKKLNTSASLNDDTRWREYERIFNSYFALTGKKGGSSGPFFSSEQQQPEFETPVISNTSGSDLLALFAEKDITLLDRIIMPIYHSLPKTMQRKGLQLIQFISSMPDVHNGTYQISRRGHLISRGQEVEDSNFLDLIHHAVRSRSAKIPPPKGWNVFLDILKRNNVPRELLAERHLSKPPHNQQPLSVGHPHHHRRHRRVSKGFSVTTTGVDKKNTPNEERDRLDSIDELMTDDNDDSFHTSSSPELAVKESPSPSPLLQAPIKKKKTKHAPEPTDRQLRHTKQTGSAPMKWTVNDLWWSSVDI